MANQEEIETMYNWLDSFHILQMGEYADFTNALYKGNFSKTLKEAQKDKHEFVLKGIDFKPGIKILDIGCGWGPMLNVFRDAGADALGLTLSSAQNKYNLSNGLKSRLQDYKDADPNEIGKFDAVVSLGAFEHFCSIKEYEAGKQEQIYGDFFKLCYDVLPAGGRLYLQTMVWGNGTPDLSKIRLDAPKDSDELILARAREFYPGSWLPDGLDQIKKCAEPYFRFISTLDGRLDYVQTLKEWEDYSPIFKSPVKVCKFFFRLAKLIPRYFKCQNFRAQLAFIWHEDQAEIFKRNIFGHERIFFEKK